MKDQIIVKFNNQKFNSDLVNAFLAADIPLNKLQNKQLKKFLENHYESKKVLDPSSWRKNQILTRSLRESSFKLKIKLRTSYSMWWSMKPLTLKKVCFKYFNWNTKWRKIWSDAS